MACVLNLLRLRRLKRLIKISRSGTLLPDSSEMPDKHQIANFQRVPLDADPVESPIVHYGKPLTAIHFETKDARWGRVTFERLDSLKVSRGEFNPFTYPSTEHSGISWVATISNSAWLRERYEYEKQCYGTAYNFNGNVDEMLEEYSHYVFRFHDQFVETIAAGIWFEAGETFLGDQPLEPSHPLKGLSHLEPTEHFESSGIRGFVRRNPLSNEDIDRAAALCSQTVFEVGAELDGTSSTSWSVTRRVKNGVPRSYLRNYFHNSVQSFDGIPTPAEIQPQIDQWFSEVSERRQKMGKA